MNQLEILANEVNARMQPQARARGISASLRTMAKKGFPEDIKLADLAAVLEFVSQALTTSDAPVHVVAVQQLYDELAEYAKNIDSSKGSIKRGSRLLAMWAINTENIFGESFKRHLDVVLDHLDETH